MTRILARICLFASCLPNLSFSQIAAPLSGADAWLTLDAKSLAGITLSNSSLAWTSEHVFNGTKSIRWDYQESGTLTIPCAGEAVKNFSALFMAFQELGSGERRKPFRLEVLQGEKTLLSAEFRTRREGWNRIELRCVAREKRIVDAFGLDRIEGLVGAQADRVRLIAPDGKAGALLIGQFLFADKELVRFETVGESPLVAFTKPPAQPVTEAARQAILRIEAKLDDELVSFPDTQLTQFTAEEAQKRFDDLHLQRAGKTWKGVNVTVDTVQIKGYISQERDYGRLMAWYAIKFRRESDAAARAEFLERYLTMFDYITYIGGTPDSWAGGDGYIEAAFLMRDELAKTGRLTAERAEEILVRMGGARIYSDVSVYMMTFRQRTYRPGEQGESCDYIRMAIPRILMAVLLAPDSPEKVRDLTVFSRWLDKVILQDAAGVCDTFKPDGTLFHHQAFQFGYGRGAQIALSRLCYLLSGTPFALPERAHEFLRERTLRVAKLAVRNIMALTQGGKESLTLQTQINESAAPWMYLALSGSPDGKEPLDRMVAAEYLRLNAERPMPNASPLHRALLADCERLGLKAAQGPAGCFVFPYGALAVQRHDDWMAQVKGYSKYLYAREAGPIFCYSAFIGNGTVEILTPEDYKHHRDGIYFHDIDLGKPGFDWSRFPGTTAVFLPLDRLKLKQKSGQSDDPFVGGVEAPDGNGIFVLSLHGHEQLGLDSFRAKKSWFIFGKKMICLGSGITDQVTDAETGTVLVQEAFAKARPPIQRDGTALAAADEISEQIEKPTTFLDSRGNGYWIAPNQQVTIRSGMQMSRTLDDKEPSEGQWTSIWLSHGEAPESSTYHYTLKPHCGGKALNAFAQSMASANPPYRVHQLDKTVHFVEAMDSHSFGYALFAAQDSVTHGPLRSASLPCVVYTKAESDGLKLCVADPNLNLTDDHFRNIDDWGYSRPTVVKLKIAGHWNSSPMTDVKANSTGNDTELEITCRDGLTRVIHLSK